jgi:outer membrane protein OmpA-like peptidoglycan-associated protein
MKNNRLVSVSLLAGAALVACSTEPPKNLTLEAARNGYAMAQGDADVTNYAAVELQEAGNALEKANNAYLKHDGSETVEHLAYLAKQRVAIAQETGKLKAAELAVSNASSERNKVLLEVRTAEANTAKQQAQAAEEDANQKTSQLEATSAQIDAARRQAMMAEETANQKAAELAASNARISQMEQELTELNAKKTDHGLVITLSDVLFDLNKTELKPRGMDSVRKLAKFLNEYPERTVRIEGFTDSTGSSEYNQKLSENRANAVRDALEGMGVSSDRVETRGYGEENPIASNDTSSGRQLNRRVEIILSEDNGEAGTP